MIKKIAIGVAVLIAALLIFASTKPDTFRVERTVSISAPPEVVYAQLDNFHRWADWSPWEDLDPNMTRSHSGAESGVGAVYEWAGNSDVGEGRMAITEANAPSNVKVALHFLAPFEAHNTAEFMLEPEGDGTSVTWAMYGDNAYLSKLMSVFISMDDMIGEDFDKGLAQLKTVAEERAMEVPSEMPAEDDSTAAVM